MTDPTPVKTMVFPPDPKSNSWFTAERVEYMRNCVSLFLMLLAIPYVLVRIVSHPVRLATGRVHPNTLGAA